MNADAPASFVPHCPSQFEPPMPDEASGKWSNKVVDLDVGGVRFRTSWSTLRKSPFFEALLRHGEEGTMDSTTTPEGLLFVDRDPGRFKMVLEFLRSGLALVPSMLELSFLQEEFRFFGLDPDAIQLAPGSQSEEVVLGVRWKHADLREVDKTTIHLRVHGPSAVLDRVWDIKDNLTSESGHTPASEQWERAASVICADIEITEAAAHSVLSKVIALPLAKLWQMDFRECGRSESSTMGYDSGDDARIHWVSETITLRRCL
eukprot:TRINITY_DN51897_c0_g1_i1.p1 TRINITY_DN51897_c0_g1~~TRINITY_DN51897_c0_g1_i1.p1  ORF type:complete len:261 (-),score=57.84 TRINITY_DN51897_c0_g1_i1:84-866(-)